MVHNISDALDPIAAAINPNQDSKDVQWREITEKLIYVQFILSAITAFTEPNMVEATAVALAFYAFLNRDKIAASQLRNIIFFFFIDLVYDVTHMVYLSDDSNDNGESDTSERLDRVQRAANLLS
jgi:glycyl-tRNA synthetase alpha subunit